MVVFPLRSVSDLLDDPPFFLSSPVPLLGCATGGGVMTQSRNRSDRNRIRGGFLIGVAAFYEAPRK